MPLVVATHSGPFHADDVLAWGLVRAFFAPDATLVRTRDPARIEQADLVYDVGAVYDPARLRFDHHQQSYEGPLSSAGMVLRWLEDARHVEPEVAHALRIQLVDYVDEVDNGRRAPDPHVPCFPNLVDAYNRGCQRPEEFDAAYLRAGEMALGVVRGIAAGVEDERRAEAAVLGAMREAEAEGRNTLLLASYFRWKPIYFAHGGERHPTEFVLFPGLDESWRIVAIPPAPDSFDQKRPLPEAWAGLTDEALEAVVGVPGARFCHKNRFIAVFETRSGALEAMRRHGLWSGSLP